MFCPYYQQQQCRSCARLDTLYHTQVEQKMASLQAAFHGFAVKEFLAPVLSAERGFRNKAKMVALGAAHQPILGIVSPSGEPVSLCDCPLYPEPMQQLLHRLERFVQQAGLPPYNVQKQKGELKFILLTQAQSSGEYMLRFVLKSEQAIPRIERELPQLLAEYPQISLVSVNLQPIHMARLEGEQEIFLTEQTRLREQFNGVPLFMRPKSFFQTNPQVAARLYQTAREWVEEAKVNRIWDLFCGVGGFGLHCAASGVQVTGIEIEAEAIACAEMSAAEMGIEGLSFAALDSTDFAQGQTATEVPELIIVNPPRAGIGETLSKALNQFLPETIIYSSCNPKTLIKDLALLTHYQAERVQLFDMFPHTDHAEVLVLLKRREAI